MALINGVDLSYTKSSLTHPIIEYTSEDNVNVDLQNIMNDFVFRVFFSKGSAIQQLLQLKESRTNARDLISEDVNDAIDVLRVAYSTIAPRLTASSIDASFVGGSKLIVRVALSVDDTGDDDVVISHAFNTTAGI